VVVASEDELGEQRLVAYVVRNSAYEGPQLRGSSSQNAERVLQWQDVWDETYNQEDAPEDPTFNLSGWTSSYTGLPIPAEEMREWVDQAVARVRALEPSRVLEIGCGVGLLLFRIAPYCTHYCGTDFSPHALRYVEHHLKTLGLPQVSLLQRTAEDFRGFEAESFDVVVLNSVVQYCPHIDYLVRVLEGAVSVVRPGGYVFLGAVRSLPLLEAFHTSVEFHRAAASLPISHLQQRVRKRMIEEEELVIDPAFFFALRHRLPQISHVEIELKRGHYHNELTRFRYEVILHVNSGQGRPISHTWLDWRNEQMTLPALRQILSEGNAEAIGITGIPNARLTNEIKTWNLLTNPGRLQTVGDLRTALRAVQEESVDPEELWALQDEVPYRAQLYWSGPAADDQYDVLIRRRDVISAEEVDVRLPASPIVTDGGQPWRVYANNPLQHMHLQALGPELRRFLQAKLPAYMVPATFVMLESLPLTPTGKLDRKALPTPDRLRPTRQEPYSVPRTRTEELVAGIWAQLLGVDKVGAYDDFFELGGHSLLAIRMLSRMRETFHVELSVRAIFETSTVAGLAQLVEEARTQGEHVEVPPIMRLSREAHSMPLLPGGVLDPADTAKRLRGEITPSRV
jgi:ubiquinone/menaquinone biosynthesis C-methylase UbiE